MTLYNKKLSKPETKLVQSFTGGKNKQSLQPTVGHKLEKDLLNVSDEVDYKVPKVTVAFSKKIQTARASKGMTRKQLAAKLNMTESEVAKYENGTAIPNPNVLNKFKKELNITK